MAPAAAFGLDFVSAVAVGAAGVVASAALYALSSRRPTESDDAVDKDHAKGLGNGTTLYNGESDGDTKLTKKQRQKLNKKKQKQGEATVPVQRDVDAKAAASKATVDSDDTQTSEEKKKKKKKKSIKNKNKADQTDSDDTSSPLTGKAAAVVQRSTYDTDDTDDVDDDEEMAFALAMAGNQKNMQAKRSDQKNREQKEQERIQRKKSVEEREKREREKAEETAKAAAEAAAIADAATPKTETTIIAIKPREVQIILGSGGKVIKQIRQESGARLDVSKRDEGSGSPATSSKQDRERRLLTIVGTQEEIDSARRLLRAVFKEENAKSEVIDVGDKMAAVIGKGGSVIKRIKEETGATLDADRETQTIRVSGEPEQIEKAVIEIKKISAPGDQISMKINKRQKMLVIGKGGLMIRKIEEMTKCQLDVVDKTEDGGGVLKIGGESAQVLEAMKTIQKLFLEASYTTTVDCGDIIGAVIGRGGEVIRKIQEETQVKLDVEMDKKCVVIIGYEKDVKRAKERIEAILACPVEVKPGQTKLHVDLGIYVSSVIGRGGQKVREIEESSGAIVKVLGTECIIVGVKKNVENAKHMIDEILKKQLDQNVQAEAAIAAVQALSESHQRGQARNSDGKIPWGCSAWGNDLAHWTAAPVAATR